MPPTHSTTLGELATALAKAQGEFEAVAKNAANPFFKSKYAALPDVVKAATPILAANGLAVTQLPGHDEQGHTLTTMVLHKSGQFIAETMRLKPVKDDPQAQGSAITYGRRYAYMAALGLVADEDDDGNAASAKGNARKPAAKKPAPRQESRARPEGGGAASEAAAPSSELKDGTSITAEQVAEVRELVTSAGWDADQLRWGLLALDVADPQDLKAAMAGLSVPQFEQLKASLASAIEEAS